MTTYVNSRKCAVISSERRGVVGSIDGRMAIDPAAFYLFASSRGSAMPGCFVRYVELRRGAASEEAVREEAQRNRIYSSWEKDREAELQRLQQNLTLSGLFKKPVPIWVHPAVLAEFGDAYLEGTGLEGGDLPGSVGVLSLLLDRLVLEHGHQGLRLGFSHEAMQAVNFVAEAFKAARGLFRKYGLVLQQPNPAAQLVHFMKKFKKGLTDLKEVRFGAVYY